MGSLRRYRHFLGGLACGVLGVGLWLVTNELRRAGGNTIHVEVVSDLARFKSSTSHVPEYILQRPVSTLGAPPHRYAVDAVTQVEPKVDPGWYEWAHHLGGVDANETVIRLRVSAAAGVTASLMHLRVRVLACRPPLHGTVVENTSSGDSLGDRVFYVEVDHRVPRVGYTWPGLDVIRQQPFPTRISDSTTRLYDVVADATTADCRWELLLDRQEGSRSRTIVVTNGRKPFETSAPAPKDPIADWLPRDQRWEIR